MKIFLIVLAACATTPVEGPLCVTSDTATVYTYSTFARCIQDREYFRTAEGREAECTGTAWVPPHLPAKG